MSAIYSYEQLKQLKGQAVKDVWHAMIGKPPGIKNTTGLKNGDEIIQAILEGLRNPDSLKSFETRAPKRLEQEEPKEMPPKEKPGPKPKPKPKVKAIAAPNSERSPTLAYESAELPLQPSETIRIVVKKLFVGDTLYFLESKTNKLYSVVDGRPGSICGLWNPQTKEVHPLDS